MAVHGIVGDEFGTELPQTKLDDQALRELQSAARFSKTKEYKKLEEHIERRIAFYQSHLPGGTPVVEVSAKERDAYWIAANVIIPEFRALLDTYSNAQEAVREAKRVR
jgi:hypothetical protein